MLGRFTKVEAASVSVTGGKTKRTASIVNQTWGIFGNLPVELTVMSVRGMIVQLGLSRFRLSRNLLIVFKVAGLSYQLVARFANVLLRFFRFLGKELTAKLQFVCRDMWQGYIKVIQKKAGPTIHLVDRFHVMQRIGQAINEVRAAEGK